MNIHDATEKAYRNGYAKGKADAFALIREKDSEIEWLKLEIQAIKAHHKSWETVRTEAINEFAERLKEAPIKCGLPLLGLQTKEEIEEYFNGIMLQVCNAIDRIAEDMKGEQE